MTHGRVRAILGAPAGSPRASRGGAGAARCFARTRGARATASTWRSARRRDCRRPGRVLRPQHAGRRRFGEADFVPRSALRPLRAGLHRAGRGVPRGPESRWSETTLVQATARQPGGRAWYLLDEEALEAARPRADGARRWSPRRTRSLPSSCRSRRRTASCSASGSRAAITHTIGGLRIDERARVLDEQGEPVDGLFAAGADAGGISTGGYASGLAAALVLGRDRRRDRAQLDAAAGRRSGGRRPGAARAPTFVTSRRPSSSSTTDRRPQARRRRARAARSRSASRRRGGASRGRSHRRGADASRSATEGVRASRSRDASASTARRR